jgi:phosphoglycerol transferase MdoB-like AlkP superfamily enzyme
MHAPGVTTTPAKIEQAGGQIDILPTVTNLLGISLQNQIHFGEDLLNQKANLLPMRHFLPTGSFINDSSLFLPGIEYDDGIDYSVIDNSELADGSTKDQYERALNLLNMSDSFVKQLPDKNP